MDLQIKMTNENSYNFFTPTGIDVRYVMDFCSPFISYDSPPPTATIYYLLMAGF